MDEQTEQTPEEIEEPADFEPEIEPLMWPEPTQDPMTPPRAAYNQYTQEELDYLSNLTKVDFLPDIAKQELFAMFNRSLILANLDQHMVRALLAKGAAIIAKIRFYLPPGRETQEVDRFLDNTWLLFAANITRAYRGFERTSQQTTFNFHSLERKQEKDDQGIINRIFK